MEEAISQEEKEERQQMHSEIAQLRRVLKAEGDEDSDSCLEEFDSEEEEEEEHDSRIDNNFKVLSWPTDDNDRYQDADSSLLPIMSEDGNLEDNPESCYMLNKAYQEYLVENIERIDTILVYNRKKQSELREALEDDIQQKVTSTRNQCPILKHSFPYFKDLNHMNPPQNEDVKIKRASEEMNAYIKPPKMCNDKERIKLHEGVREDCMQLLIRPLMNSKEIYIRKLKQIAIEEEKEELKECLKDIDKKIADIRKMSDERLFFEVPDTSKLDWMKIAATDMNSIYTASHCHLHWKNVMHPSISKASWTKEEDEKLKELTQKHKNTKWNLVAKELGTNRSPIQCLQRFQSKLNPISSGKWSVQEEALLLELVELESMQMGKKIQWQKIAEYMEGRSPTQCMEKYTILKPKAQIKRGKWTQEEDVNLRLAIKRIGMKDWTRVASFLNSRTGYQCRERWYNALDPSLRIGHWSHEEDRKLWFDIIDNGGPEKIRWAELVKEFPGRTDNMLLQRYRRLEKWHKVRGSSLNFQNSFVPNLEEEQKLAIVNGQLVANTDRSRKNEPVPTRPITIGLNKSSDDVKKVLRTYMMKASQKEVEDNLLHNFVRDFLEAKPDLTWKHLDMIQQLITDPTGVPTLIFKGFQLPKRKRKSYKKSDVETAKLEQAILKELMKRPVVKRRAGRPRKYVVDSVRSNLKKTAESDIVKKTTELLLMALNVNMQQVYAASEQRLNCSVNKTTQESSSGDHTSEIQKDISSNKFEQHTQEPIVIRASDTPQNESQDETAISKENSIRNGSQNQTTISKENSQQNGSQNQTTISKENDSVTPHVYAQVVVQNEKYNGLSSDNVDNNPGNSNTTDVAEDKAPAYVSDIRESSELEGNKDKHLQKDDSTMICTKTPSDLSKQKTNSSTDAINTDQNSVGDNSKECDTQQTDTALNLSTPKKPTARKSPYIGPQAVKAYNLPPLPPSTVSLAAFKTILLERKSIVGKAGDFHVPGSLGQQTTKKRPLNKDSLQINMKSRKTGICAEKTSALQKIRNTHDYQQLNARFASIFLWPAFLSTVSVERIENPPKPAATASKTNTSATVTTEKRPGTVVNTSNNVQLAGGAGDGTAEVNPSPPKKRKKSRYACTSGRRSRKFKLRSKENKEMLIKKFLARGKNAHKNGDDVDQTKDTETVGQEKDSSQGSKPKPQKRTAPADLTPKRQSSRIKKEIAEPVIDLDELYRQNKKQKREKEKQIKIETETPTEVQWTHVEYSNTENGLENESVSQPEHLPIKKRKLIEEAENSHTMDT